MHYPYCRWEIGKTAIALPILWKITSLETPCLKRQKFLRVTFYGYDIAAVVQKIKSRQRVNGDVYYK